MRVNKKGFIFIETIVVVCVLTVSLMSLYANYSKIISNTKELNTFDTAEYNYKTYFLKKNFFDPTKLNECFLKASVFSDNTQVKICQLSGVSEINYLEDKMEKLDAYIIDYLNTKDFTSENDNIFLVEYKKKDKNSGEYLTYISSLNY